MLGKMEGRVATSQRERDVLKVIQSVVDGKRSQAEAARLLTLSSRQVRRLVARGDASLVHGLRGRPSNLPYDASFRKRVLRAYQQRSGRRSQAPKRRKRARRNRNGTRNPDPRHATDRRALGSHSCEALSSRRRVE